MLRVFEFMVKIIYALHDYYYFQPFLRLNILKPYHIFHVLLCKRFFFTVKKNGQDEISSKVSFSMNHRDDLLKDSPSALVMTSSQRPRSFGKMRFGWPQRSLQRKTRMALLKGFLFFLKNSCLKKKRYESV